MQLKYLQFHKLISSFAQELVGAFIPLILYKVTGNITLSISYYILQRALMLTFNLIFKKFYYKNPQIFLLLRMIPMLFYYIFILLIDVNVWVACAGVLFFSGLSESFKNIPTDTLYNYNSLNTGSKTLGFTKVLERLGLVAAQILGALFLDYISKYVLIAISLILYLISTLPLFISYFKYKSDSSFNQDAISNATIHFKSSKAKMAKHKVVTKKIFTYYIISFALFCFCDLNTGLFGLFLYVKLDKYMIVGVISLLYFATQIPFNYLVGKLDEKKDILPYVATSAIITGVLNIVLAGFMIFSSFNLTIIIISLVIFTIMGALYPFLTIFYFDRMLLKSRILGKSNQMILARDFSGYGAQLFSVIPGLGGNFGLVFLLMGISIVLCGATLPKVEEKSRVLLINYLEND